MGNKNLYTQIVNKLKNTRNLIYLTDIIWGVITSLIVLEAIILITSFIEYLGNFPSEARLFFYFLFWLALIVPFGAFSLSPLLKILGLRHQYKLDKLALRIGTHYIEIKDKLSNSIQMMSKLELVTGTSRSLTIASSNQVFELAKNKNFNVVINKKKLLFVFLYFLLSSVIFVSSFTLFKTELGSALYRINNWSLSFIPPPPFSLEVSPIRESVLKNTDVQIKVIAKGTPPESIQLQIKEKGSEEFDGFTLRLDSGNVYQFTLTKIKNSVEFYAEAEWLHTKIMSKRGNLNVYEKPYIKSISGEVVYPKLTKIEPRQLSEQNGDIAALRGSSANFTLAANTKLREAKLCFVTNSSNDSISKSDTSFIPMRVYDTKAKGVMKITRTGTYFFKIIDKNNQENEQPVNFGVIALDDEYPSISLINPPGDVKIGENAILPMDIKISDDFGFSELRLYYKMTYSKYAQPEEEFRSFKISINLTGTKLEIPYIWNLQNLDIVPNDIYEFYLEVADNDYISGPKKSKTNILTIKMPTIDEILSESDNVQQIVEKSIEKTLKEVQELQKDIEQLQRDLKKDKYRSDLTWDEQKKAKDIIKQQNELKQKMQDIQEQISKNTDQLKQNNLLSDETLQKYQELQKLMQEVESPELRKMQQKIEEAARKMSKEEMEKALKNFQFNEEQFKQSIERTMNILKRLQLEQKIDALNRRAEKMQDEQENLEKQTKDAKSLSKEEKDAVKKKQNELKDNLNSVEDELKDVKKLMEQLKDDQMPLSEFQDAQRALNKDETQQEMQNANSDLDKNDMKSASSNMQKAKNNLANFKQKMQKLKEEMDQRGSKEAIRQMEKSISDMLKLSKQQERLLDKTSSLDNNSTQLPAVAREQMNQFEGLMKVAERLSELGEKSFGVTPQMGNEITNALQQMNSALESFNDRDMKNMAEGQSQALGSMNNAIGQMQQMLNDMQQSGNGSCPNPGGAGQSMSAMGEKLQQLAAQQQAINQMMQQMMSGSGQNTSGGGMSQDQRSNYQRIMDNQNQAQKTLQELQEESKQFSNTPEGKKLKNDLDKIAKEMQEIVSDVKINGVRKESFQRQENILSKLLELYDSQNEKELEKQREAKTGKNIFGGNPEDIDFSKQEGQKAIIEQLLKQSSKNYSSDYQNLIKQYFDNLKNQNKEN